MPVERRIKVQPVVTIEPRVEERTCAIRRGCNGEGIVAQHVNAFLHRDFNGRDVVLDFNAVHHFKTTPIGKGNEYLVGPNPRAEIQLTRVKP